MCVRERDSVCVSIGVTFPTLLVGFSGFVTTSTFGGFEAATTHCKLPPPIGPATPSKIQTRSCFGRRVLKLFLLDAPRGETHSWGLDYHPTEQKEREIRWELVSDQISLWLCSLLQNRAKKSSNSDRNIKHSAIRFSL